MDVSAVVNSVKTQPDPRFELVKPETQTQARPQPDQAVAIASIISELEQVSAAFSRRLSFSINEKLGEVVVKVIDTQTDKVIKEIPPEELQHVHERIREVLGILFDQRV
ncbi:MAG: flagellar protein FlaG [Spirochaetes bacterium]|nr:flagellar protein FlaG [Spirochaetota bacterium]